MAKATEKLKGYLEENYIDDPSVGSPDMSTAIRDLITDLFLIGDEIDIDIRSRMLDSEDVYQRIIEQDL